MGVLPFIVGDIIKIGGAAAIAKAITPKEPFNGGENSVDNDRKWKIL
jgi:biotin transport system substrate-specific component